MTTQEQESTDRKTRLILSAYLILAAAPLIAAATTSAYWRHALAPTATVLIAALLFLLARRHRWAWLALGLLEGVVLISFAFDFTNAFYFFADLTSFALLVSPPMRRYVRPQH